MAMMKILNEDIQVYLNLNSELILAQKPFSSGPIRFCFLLVLSENCSMSLPVGARGDISPTSLPCGEPQGAAVFNLTRTKASWE